MSVTYSARVICGFKIEEKEAIGMQTRYNNLTGEPYSVEVKSVKLFIGDIELKDLHDIYDGEKFHGLDVIVSGDDWTRNIFLGEVVAATGEHYSLCDEFLINIPVKVHTFGEEMGVDSSFFLTFNC